MFLTPLATIINPWVFAGCIVAAVAVVFLVIAIVRRGSSGKSGRMK